ncbi:MAG: arginine repressor [Bacteroidaceae bacterium]|nr:arginine repressor [Bacteroidaceae bacterium]
MKDKHLRLEAIKIIISSREIGSQDEILQELLKEGFTLTQATLSRDLKQLKVAKAASMNGNYVYVLPNDTMYKRSTSVKPVKEMMQTNGLLNIRFSGNIGVIKTRPGYASSMAYDIDMENIPYIIGTVAGDDTIVLVLEEGAPKETVRRQIQALI